MQPQRRSFYRSAPMSLIQLYIPTEAVLPVIAELGELGAVQFHDLNSEVTAFQRVFTPEIRKLDALEKKVLVLIEHASKEDVEIRSWASVGGAPDVAGTAVSFRGRALQEMDELEKQLYETESRVLQLDQSQKEIMARYMFTLEWLGVIRALAPYFSDQTVEERRPIAKFIPPEGPEDSSEDSESTANLDDKATASMELGGPDAAQTAQQANYVVGVIPKRKLAAFERVLWRALRGNILVRSADCLLDPRGLSTDPADLEPRSAFIAYVHGRETLSRLRRICEALGCSIHDLDPSADRRAELAEELSVKIEDMYAVLFNTKQTKRAALCRVSESLERFLLLVRKKKAVYDIMNFFSCDSDAATRKYYLAEGWCPTESLGAIDSCIKAASERANVNVAPVMTVLEPSQARQPPTYFPTNKLTATIQEMTESYAIAKYGEANPSIFMIITFPFLFAVMYGDFVHGLLMAITAALMVLNEKRLARGKLDEILSMIFEGRYVILLMGLFSVYVGVIYNDFASRALFLFPSAWTFGSNGVATRPNPNYVYPIGIDPSWYMAGNALNFLNSYKMKMAIVLGIIHMTFGLLVNAHNLLHFGLWLDIWAIFVPQILFMSSIFGYLAFMILYKWVAGWDSSILNMLIAMMMRFGAVEGEPIYPGQALVQTSLMMLAFICVPWMLLAKPIYLIVEGRQKRRANASNVAYQQAPEHSDSTGTESVSSTTKKVCAEDEQHAMSDLWVHQLIHTIEFVLGSVSNTASYLRLWALSLAHAELSEVLWSMTIEKTVGNPLVLFFSFIGWLFISVAILVILEGLSAFLHALRLHWIEFNNKFYTGGGQKFEPFILSDDRLFISGL